ncbi:hypothetical protein [Leucobacter sp. OH1287]|uniref:hypothetical protein n=1 Tax=Leucobacter sp. OH1287 TaxID=2491049 RepID=UPI000F5FD8BD|nr:hypothetical protein [Leucobacter sp. OH1287]RRD60856.1 hypothetical protein EII30_04730 [Leucobacter sp. OH1287]
MHAIGTETSTASTITAASSSVCGRFSAVLSSRFTTIPAPSNMSPSELSRIAHPIRCTQV